MKNNFNLIQYKMDSRFSIKHNYLKEQFNKPSKEILIKIKKLISNGDYTLGKEVEKLENNFKKKINAKYAIGVGSGTDAIFLSLIALNIGKGDEVIAPSYTFHATIGAIATTGAKPIFAEIGSDLNISPSDIEKKITKNTKAIVPVHWTGRPCNMNAIKKIAKKYDLKIIEDACHAYLSKYDNNFCGNFGDFGCFSFHPLKNLNVWGDGGIVITNKKKYMDKIRLLRNHGLKSRNNCELYAYNSRLDTIQAIVANVMLKKISYITNSRIYNSLYLDHSLKDLPEVELIPRSKNLKEVFHLYIIKVKNRNKLHKYLNSKSIDSKIHYPIPMHLQKASRKFGYKKGDLPYTELIVKSIISLPVHEFINKKDLDKMISTIKSFYKKN